jgi:hypothetical protein
MRKANMRIPPEIHQQIVDVLVEGMVTYVREFARGMFPDPNEPTARRAIREAWHETLRQLDSGPIPSQDVRRDPATDTDDVVNGVGDGIDEDAAATSSNYRPEVDGYDKNAYMARYMRQRRQREQLAASVEDLKRVSRGQKALRGEERNAFMKHCTAAWQHQLKERLAQRTAEIREELGQPDLVMPRELARRIREEFWDETMMGIAKSMQ